MQETSLPPVKYEPSLILMQSSIKDVFIISPNAHIYKSVCKNKNPPYRRASKYKSILERL